MNEEDEVEDTHIDYGMDVRSRAESVVAGNERMRVRDE